MQKIAIESSSYREVNFKLGYKAYSGDNLKKIKQKFEEYNIDTSHFVRGGGRRKSSPEEEVFIKNSKVAQTTLRRYFLSETLEEYKCSICGQEPFWNNKELTLILDHIDGDHYNNLRENLRWVCPNCNQQLDTTGSKNKKRYNYKEN